MFKVHVPVCISACYIIFEGQRESISNDDCIAHLIDMNYKDYCNLLKLYGAHCDGGKYNYFNKYEDAQKAVDYLNDTYLVVLKLCEEI